MNKSEAQVQLNKLQEEVNKLKKIIEASEDLFSKIKNYSDVCKELRESRQSSAFEKLKQIERLFNGDWKKDWSDNNQAKWYPYFEYKTGSGGLSFNSSGYGCSSASGLVAYFKDEKTASFCGKTFIDIYRELL